MGISALDGLRKQLNKKYEKEGLEVVRVGVSEERFNSTLSLGSPSLDWMVYNSIPEGIFVEIAGMEASGKTTLAFLIASDFIKKQKRKKAESDERNAKIIADYEAKCEAARAAGKKDPAKPILDEYKVRHIMFVDAEGTADPRWAKTSSGYDMNDEVVETLYHTPLGQSAEAIFDDVKEAVQTGEIGLVIFDSLVAIAGKQVNAESMEKKQMGGIASILGDFVKRCTGVFNRFRTTFIGINGIYMDPSGYGNPEKVGGGLAWKRACSLRLMTKRGNAYNLAGEEWSPTGKDAAKQADGHIINVALLKTKFCRWDRKLAQCHLDYVRGMDLLQDTIDVAKFFGIINEVSPGYFIVADPDTGEALSGKIHGKGNVKPFFEENKDVWKRIYDTIYTKLAIKDVPNAVSFETMLNINVNDIFGAVLDEEVNVEKRAVDESNSVFAGIAND